MFIHVESSKIKRLLSLHSILISEIIKNKLIFSILSELAPFDIRNQFFTRKIKKLNKKLLELKNMKLLVKNKKLLVLTRAFAWFLIKKRV